MRRILSVGVLQNLLRAKNDALRHAGYSVRTCTSVVAARALFREEPFDVVIIGHGIRLSRRVSLATFLRGSFPAVRIIFLYLQSINSAELADAVISAEAPPEDLVAAVEHLLRTKTGIASVQTEPSPLKPNLPAVLCVCMSGLLAALRQDMLSNRHYEVLPAASLSEVEIICGKKNIELLIFGAAVGPQIKTAVFELIRKHNRAPALLEIGQTRPFLPGARTVSDSAEALTEAVNNLLSGLASTTFTVGKH